MKFVRFTADSGPIQSGWLGTDGKIRSSVEPLKRDFSGRVIADANEVTLRAPCIPGKVVCLANNFRDEDNHGTELDEPLIFIKAGTSVCGPGDDIICPFKNAQVWGEPELAIVLGAEVKNASLETARRSIFGYTIANDVTADNVNGWDHHLAKSKSLDTFCPIGPWIDVNYEPAGRAITGYHNEELHRQGNTDDRLWKDDASIVRWLSRWITLQPWDVILTGTPHRVIPRKYFGDGDVYKATIDGLGTLTNAFRFASAIE